MKNFTKIVAAIVGLATLAMQAPAVNSAVSSFFVAHSNFSTIFFGVTSILALIHQPAKQ